MFLNLKNNIINIVIEKLGYWSDKSFNNKTIKILETNATFMEKLITTDPILIITTLLVINLIYFH